MAVLFHSTVMSPQPWRDALRARDPSIDFRVYPDFGAPEEIDCLLAWRPPTGTFARLPNLKLIYGTGAGVDQLLVDPELPPDLPILRIVDPAQADEMTAYVMAVVLAQHRQLALYREQQRAAEWTMQPYRYVTDLRIGVMGLGALDSGHLAGATLDVFRTEPLPAAHPFWRHPKIAVTPHVASLARPATAADQILDNLRRLAAGQPLINQVDRQAGY